MKKTFTTTLPDHVGAFLNANVEVARLGLNITRVSYNRAIDAHMLFVEVEGTDAELSFAEERLTALGYLKEDSHFGSVILLEFRMKDEPTRLLPVLSLINDYHFNITYISSQSNNSGYQNMKIGIYVEDGSSLPEFLIQAARICPVRTLNYDKSEKILDNTVFYLNFAETLCEKLSLSEREKQELIINANRIMQILDEEDKPFYKTFDYIGRLADHIQRHKNEDFFPRISEAVDAVGDKITLLEPPCGSNIIMMESGDELIFADSGYACYKPELDRVLDEIYPRKKREKAACILTHADVDHAGNLDWFRRIYMSAACKENFRRELAGEAAYREEKPLHSAHAQINKIISSYVPPSYEKLIAIDEDGASINQEEALQYIGKVEIGKHSFEAYAGKGGHVKGECIYIERKRRIAITGDIFVNIHDFSPEQKAFNKLAPYLMASVDSDPKLAKEEREAFFRLLDEGDWTILCGHGGIYRYTAPATDK